MARDPPGRSPTGRPADRTDPPTRPPAAGPSNHPTAAGVSGERIAGGPATRPGPGERFLHRQGSRAGPGDGSPTVETGTTVVGLRTDEAVVLAADRRASLGGRFVANKDVRKVEAVHPTAGVALSGGVGPIQSFARGLRAEASLYETRRGEPPTMEALSTLAGHLIRGIPAQALLGGVTPAGANGADAPVPRLFEMDGGGSVLETEYAAAGSGMQVAYGTLEDAHREGMDADAARRLGAEAVASASERDTASGNGTTLVTVDAEGVTAETVGGPDDLNGSEEAS